MLRLPASFFRRYQVGDLAERSLVVNAVNEQVTDVVVLALIGGVFGLFNLVAMIIISPQLAVVGLLLCGAGALALFLTRRAGSKPWVEMLDGNREISAEILQYFTGIVKIRTSGSERKVFSRWAQHYAQQNVRALNTFRIDNVRVVFQASFRTCAVLFVVHCDLLHRPGSGATGRVHGFPDVAFGQLLFSFFQISSSFATILEARPTLEQCRPILDTPTESDDPKEHPGHAQRTDRGSQRAFPLPGRAAEPVRRPVTDHRAGRVRRRGRTVGIGQVVAVAPAARASTFRTPDRSSTTARSLPRWTSTRSGNSWALSCRRRICCPARSTRTSPARRI